MGNRLHGRSCSCQAPNYLGSCRERGRQAIAAAVGRQGLRQPHHSAPPTPRQEKLASWPVLRFTGLFCSFSWRREPHAKASGIAAFKPCFLCLWSHPQVSPFGLLGFPLLAAPQMVLTLEITSRL